jgi:hypothetical protein
VVSELIYCLYISGKEENEELKNSDTHQVISELVSVCILQTEGERGRKHSNTHVRVVSKLTYCLYISGKRRKEEQGRRQSC